MLAAGNDTPLTFYLTAILVVVTAVVGGFVVITHPETLSFQEYLIAEGAFLAGAGLFAGGSAKAEKPPESNAGRPPQPPVTVTVEPVADPVTPAPPPAAAPPPQA